MPRAASASGHVQRDAVGDRGGCLRRIQRDRTARETIRIDAAKHHVGIGDRRLLAAAAIAGGSRLGAGAVGTDHDAAQRVDPRDRAASRANLHHVDDRNAHRNAAAFGETIGAGDLEVAGLLRRVIVDQSDLRGRAAHVERQGAIVAATRRDAPRQDDAAGRTAFDQAHRKAARRFDRANTAGGHHQQQRAGRAQMRRDPFAFLADSAPSAAAHRRWRPWSRSAHIRGFRGTPRATA